MHKRWIVLIGLMASRLVFGFQFHAVAAVGAGISQSFNLSLAEYGILVGLFMAPGILMSVPGGLMLQRLGDKKVMRLSMILITAGALLSAASTGFELLSLGRLVAGIGAVLIGIAANKLAYEWFEGRELVTAMSLNLAGFPIGIALAFALLGSFNNAIDWRVALYIACAISLIALILVWLFVDAVEANAEVSHEFVSRQELGLAILIGVSWGSVNAALITSLAFSPPLLASHGMPVVEIGFLMALGPIAAALSIPLGGMLVDRFGRPGLIVVLGFGLWAILQPMLIEFGSVHWIVAFVMIATAIGGGAPSGVIVAAAGQASRPQSRAVAMGIFFSMFYAMGLIAPPIAGAVVDISNNEALPMLVASAWLILAILSYGLFRRALARG